MRKLKQPQGEKHADRKQHNPALLLANNQHQLAATQTSHLEVDPLALVELPQLTPQSSVQIADL